MTQNKNTKKGHCLCEAVKVTAQNVDSKMGVCHCGMCRKWAGGPFMGVDCGTEVSFDGKENIETFNSSEWAQRGFCKKCGSHLFYFLKQQKQYIIPIGIFENLDSVTFDHQVFIDKKPSYYEFANKTHNMTGAELFAKFA